uniref:Starch-binding domain-containing protein 1 isoform X2 n=1 Tax=Pogona vitticeps TaxID=103695 RepID=A0ABM5GKI3_9SAUR
MAAGEAGEGAQVAADPAAALPAPPPPPSPAGDGGALAGFWPAVLVALVAAFLAWLWYGRGDGPGKEAEAEAAVAQGSSPRREAPGGEGTPGPREPFPRFSEPLQKSCDHVVSETKPRDVSHHFEPVENQLVPPAEGTAAPSLLKESPETESMHKQSGSPVTNYKDYVREETPFSYPAAASEPPHSKESPVPGVNLSAEAGPSGEKDEERCTEQLRHHSVDHEEWEVVPEHSAWGGTGARKSSVDDASCKDLDQAKRVAAVSPMPQTVHVLFRVHYITHSEAQLIAITGDHECLGQWQHYVPLRCDKYGFWSDSVILPVDTRVEWKFIVVENGKVRRWEECDNRVLTTDHQDRVAHKWWGYH